MKNAGYGFLDRRKLISKGKFVEIEMKLNGDIKPVGDSNIDENRFQNLLSLCIIVDDLVTKIDAVASIHERDLHMASVAKAQKYASNFLEKTLGICD